jgi:hypothetical protein
MASPRSLILVALTACGYADPPNVCTPPTRDDACPAPPDTCADDLDLQLAAIQPSIANPGDTIMLEGTFLETETAPTKVIFPGGTEQVATVTPGGHRASVSVPGNAKTGDLFVKTGPYCLGGARFRSASFGQMLQLFVNGPRLKTQRTQFAAVLVNDSLYVLGGDNGGALTSVERAPITTSGLGSFETDALSLTTARAQPTIAVVGKWLYVLGGIAEQPYALATIERAPISSDGRLGPFEKVEKELRNPRLGHSSVVIGNRLYVLGGVSSTTGQIVTTGDDIQFATIAANGDLDEFVEIADRVLPKPDGGTVRTGVVSVVFGDFLYVLGGYYRSPVNDGKQEADVDALQDVDNASISGTGTFGEFQPARAILSVKRAAPATAVIGRSLYLFGGFNFVNGVGDNYLQSSERVEIDGDSLTSFDPVAPLGKARGGAAAAVVGNSICVLGGQEKGGGGGPPRLDTVECAASSTAE